MNVESFDIEIVEQFHFAYYFATLKFNKIIETKDAKKQHRIRKWLYKKQINTATLPADIIEFLNSLSDNDFICFFKSCYEHIETNRDALTQQINKTCKKLPEEVKNAFFHLFDREYYVKNDFKLLDNVLEVSVNTTAAYEEKLILSNAKYLSDKKFDTFCFFENCSLTKDNGIYKLTGEASSFDEEEFELSVTFTSAKTKIVSLNPTNSYLDNTPWEQLLGISHCILDKEDFENSFNELEIKLLPLLKEIKSLLFAFGDSKLSFPIFEALVKKHGFYELLPVIEKIKAKNISDKRKVFFVSQLTNKLNLIKYKPLWQEIYDLICESQKEYPTYTQSKQPKNVITRRQNKATKLMREHGYNGEYPLFYKKGSLKGFHLFESYDMSYFTILEKNPIHYIQFEENHNQEDDIFFNFSYGTEFLKPKEKMSDINSCRFNCKGKKHINSISFKADYDEDEKISLEERINIAVKLAEFKKLSKEEKSKTFNAFGSLSDKFTVFLITFILSGFLFASLFIPAMMAFCAFMLWIDGMPVIINDIPWLIFYFVTWAGFGIPMGIITVFSKK